MEQSVAVFNFEDYEVRTVVDDAGEPWFVAKDVCAALEIFWAGSGKTLPSSVFDDDELTAVQLQSGGQNREMCIISESALYTLSIRSNKPNAKKFRKWVTSEVLPSIRKTGQYVLFAARDQAPLDLQKLNEIGYATRSAAQIVKGDESLVWQTNGEAPG